jgi:hypothetical protein
MKSALTRMFCRFLAIALLGLPFQGLQAAMIGTDQVNSAISVQADRDTVLNYLNRAQTANELQALGVDAQTARERVAAMTDAEVGALAGQINAVPAGADAGAVVLLAVVVFAIWYFAFRR